MSRGSLIANLVELARRASRFRALRRVLGQRHRTIALLERSPLFDRDWYVREYPDVAAAGADPAWHYITSGWREGRDPGPLFSTKAYLRKNSDVARSGANPLLHFIEHGFFEGRGTTKHRAMLRRAASPGEPFGTATPCASFPLPPEAPVRWQRASRFDRAAEHMVVIGDLPVGRVADAKRTSEVQAAFACLRKLSGISQEVGGLGREDADAVLVDAWYIERNRLRTRWQSPRGPIAVRAYQVDPDGDGAIVLVGEGLAERAVDFVDTRLCNRYFPVLFIISSADGEVQECRMRAFPSLCRGAPHYPELLALHGRQDLGKSDLIDIVAHSQALADRLMAVFEQAKAPLISSLTVDLAGADGTELLFDAEFRLWMTHVVRVGIHPPGRREEDYLASIVGLRADGTRSTKGGTLVLAGDMIPTISILCARGAQGRDPPVDTSFSLIVAGADASQPATLFELPEGEIPLQSRSPDYPAAWPRLISNAQIPQSERVVAAIRLSQSRELTDAELLVPVSGPGFGTRSADRSISWLVRVAYLDFDLLAPTIHSLAEQVGAGDDHIVLIGEPTPAVNELAETLFGDRVRHVAHLETAVSEIETLLVGHVGPGIILHDTRSANLLCSMLDDPAIATASCPLVHVESRGISWHVDLVDVGNKGTAPIAPIEALRLWRTEYPVASPSPELWAATTRSLADWLSHDGSSQLQEGFHICTSFITASISNPERHEPAQAFPPGMPPRSLRTEALFG